MHSNIQSGKKRKEGKKPNMFVEFLTPTVVVPSANHRIVKHDLFISFFFNMRNPFDPLTLFFP